MLNHLSKFSRRVLNLESILKDVFLLLVVISSLKDVQNIFIVFMVLAFFLSNNILKRMSCVLISFSSTSLCMTLFNFVSFNQSSHPLPEYLTTEALRLFYFSFPKEMLIQITFLSFLALTLQKDLKNLSHLKLLYEKSFQDKENITNSLEVAVIFIDIYGNVLKFNSKAEILFGSLKVKNIYQVLPSEKVTRVREMVKICQKKLIPEEDFNLFIPGYGKMYFILSMKCVPLNNTNSFLLHFVDMNLSAKKRTMVMKSYLSNLFLQSKTMEKFAERYLRGSKVSLKDFGTLVKYIYSQQETICITQMVTGQILNYHSNFDLKHEIANVVQFYWERLKKKNVRISFACQSNLKIVQGDKVKHHLLLKSLLNFLSLAVTPGSDVEIVVKREGVEEFQYRVRFQTSKIKKDVFQVFFRSGEDLDEIYNVQNKYDLTVCLFPWLVQVLDGTIDKVKVEDEKVSLVFRLRFNEGDSFPLKQFYFLDMPEGKDIYTWPASSTVLLRSSISLLKLRRKLGANSSLGGIQEELCKEPK